MKFSFRKSKKYAKRAPSDKRKTMCGSKKVFSAKRQRCVKKGGPIDRKEGLTSFRKKNKALRKESTSVLKKLFGM